MKEKLLALVLSSLGLLPCMADQLTPEESLARFAALQKGPNRIQEASKQGLQLVYTESDEGKSLFYVFSNPAEEGFVILGADDTVPVVLGYSAAGPFDIDNLPPNLQYWLEDCSRAISATIGADRPLAQPAKRARATIAPIITTTWGQGQESKGVQIYNKYSPVIEGKVAPTGCVATAMAQVMNYHKWPNRGIGSKSYTTDTYKKSLSANFSSTTYDWANMKDHYAKTWNSDEYSTYDAGYTSITNEAVSKLMFHCGVAANMDYGPDQSGAYDYNALNALVANFNYNPNAYMAMRDYYTDEEWEDLVYNQLLANRPIYYTGGTANNEGHAFVCDGYKNGMFHINWGWNGMSDGYYTIMGRDALHPTAQGTGGSYTSDAFCLHHTIFADVTKPAVAPAAKHFFGISGDYKIYDYDSEEPHLYNGNYVIAKFEHGCFNFEAKSVEVIAGVHLISTENGKEFYLEGDSDYETIKLGQGFSYTAAICKNVPDGVYKAIPTFRYKGESRWTDAHVMTGVSIPLVGVGNAEVPVDKADAQLCCSTVQFTDGGNNQRKLNLHVTNPGNVGSEKFVGYVAPGIVKEDGSIVVVLESAKQAFEMESMKYSSDKTFDFSAAIPSSVADGHYYAALCAFQTGSNNWTPACYLDANNTSYDKNTITASEFWLNGNSVSTTEPKTKDDALLCCSTVQFTDGGNNQRKLNLHVTNPGNVGSEKFVGYVAPGIVKEDGSIVVVLESAKQAFEMESMKYSSDKTFDFSVVIPSSVADGHYYAALCAFQTGSSNWTLACYLDANNISYDTNTITASEFWLNGNSVSTTELKTKDDALLCCSTVEVYEGINNQRTLKVHITNPGNVGDEYFSGYVAPAILNTKGEIIAVLDGVKQSFEMESMKYNSDKTFDFSAVIPSSVADGQYYAALCAFQTGSKNWTLACYLDASSLIYDPDTYPQGEFWLTGNTVSTMEPVTKPDAELCCNTVSITDGGNNLRTLNVSVTSPGNVGDEKFEGYVAPGILDENGHLIVVLESAKKQFDIESMKCKSSTTLEYSAAIPNNIPDGHYYVAFCAFQTRSTNWTVARYLDANLKYDPNQVPKCEFWLKGKKVDTNDSDGIHDILATEAPQTDIYDLQGRRITTPATRGISIVGSRKVIR